MLLAEVGVRIAGDKGCRLRNHLEEAGAGLHKSMKRPGRLVGAFFFLPHRLAFRSEEDDETAYRVHRVPIGPPFNQPPTAHSAPTGWQASWLCSAALMGQFCLETPLLSPLAFSLCLAQPRTSCHLTQGSDFLQKI